MTDLPALRLEAEALARALPRLFVRTKASEAVHLGSAGRRRAGTGEDFWQYRRYAQEDDASRVDWRRSARGDSLFVRETELETARSIHFWVDPHDGFDWTGDGARHTKADRARLLMMATANLLSREGERVGVLGGAPAGFGKRALERLYTQLCEPLGETPRPPRRSGTVVVASDFYDPVSTWKARLAPLAKKARHGVLIAVSDPVEHAFPFEGRVRLSRPGSLLERILGRAETVREAYLQRFEANRAELRDLAGHLRWRLIEHETGDAPITGAAKLHEVLTEIGVPT
ncbi:MAG: DUF58 domain-containing protein [Pseudomonadota bacterium]